MSDADPSHASVVAIHTLLACGSKYSLDLIVAIACFTKYLSAVLAKLWRETPN
jgi:hypothetical protein